MINFESFENFNEHISEPNLDVQFSMTVFGLLAGLTKTYLTHRSSLVYLLTSGSQGLI